MKIEKFDELVQTMPYPIRSAWFCTDQEMRQRMAANTPDDISRDNLLAILSYSLEGPEEEDEEDEEDLMDGDLENLLAEGDKEDAKLPRHCIDDLEKRYVLLTKIDGRYLTNIASDDLAEIDRLKDVAYARLNSLIHREGQGVAAITVFDRDADMDLYHVEMCLYRPREASKFEQAMKGVEA